MARQNPLGSDALEAAEKAENHVARGVCQLLLSLPACLACPMTKKSWLTKDPQMEIQVVAVRLALRASLDCISTWLQIATFEIVLRTP